MRALDDHAARHFGNVAQRIAAAPVRFDDDQVARTHCRKGAAAGLAITHRRGARGQRSGITVGKADLRRPRRFRQHRGDAPIVIVDADEARREAALPLVVGLDRRDRPRPALASIITLESLAQRHRRARLHLAVIRRAHPQAAGIDAVRALVGGFAELRDQLAPHLFHIIAADLRDRSVAAIGEAKRHRARGVALRGADPAIVLHRTEHEIAPRDRLALKPRAAVFFGRLGQDCEEGHFVQLELIDVLVEIGAARRLHAESAAAERDFVQIQLENLFLGQRILDTHRKDRLAHLAAIAELIGEQQVLRDLLGDRRGADRAAAVAEVRDDRADDARIVDAAVAEKGLVLGREEGAHQKLRIFAIFKLDAAFARIAVHRLALAVADHRRQRRFIVAQLVDRRQVARENHPDQREEKDACQREIAEPAEPAPRPHIAEPCDDGIAVAAQAQAEIGRTVSGHMPPPLKPASPKGKHACGEVRFYSPPACGRGRGRACFLSQIRDSPPLTPPASGRGT